MAPKWRFFTLALIFILPLVVTFVSRDVATAPNSVELVCQVGTITTPLHNNHIVLPVLMSNFHDSIAGFVLLVTSSYGQFVRFAVESQVGDVFSAKFDTVGTRCRGFKYLQARIQDTLLRSQVKVVGLCDPDSPRVVKPIPPGSGTLLNLIMETNGTLGDSLCDSITVVLQLNRYQTSFSDPASGTIGCNYVMETDTTHPGGCKIYAPPPHADSCIGWWDTVLVHRLRCVSIDTLRRVLMDGSCDFVCCQCGDANGNGAVNISDAVFLVSYIFSGGPAPGPCGGNSHGLGDANGNNAINISDAVYLIAYIFSGGAAPHCQP
jgi:hypothetical protein